MKELCYVPLCVAVSLSTTAFAQDDAKGSATKETTDTETADSRNEESVEKVESAATIAGETKTDPVALKAPVTTAEPVAAKAGETTVEPVAVQSAVATNAKDAEVETAESTEDDPFKRITLTANPLSLLQTRLSMNVEIMLAKHHGLIVVPSIWGLMEYNEYSDLYTYVGGELGYHYYTGQRGANGFFAGPSFMYFTDSKEHLIGFALDIGGQHVARNGFTIGGGVGLMWIEMIQSEILSPISTVFISEAPKNKPVGGLRIEGLTPRLLFTIGYSF